MALILFFALSITFSFLCSIWEAVLLSISPSYMSRLQKEKPTLAKEVKEMKTEVDRPLSAILSLNTIAHTVGAIGVGAQAGHLYGSNQLSIGGLGISYESLIAGSMTLAILILSEIIPKTIGANNWKRLTPFTVKSLKIILVIMWPLVVISQWITKRMKKDKDHSVLSRADVTAIMEVSSDQGALHPDESRIINNLLRLQDVEITNIMTPRTTIVAAEESLAVGEAYEQLKNTPFSRIPLYIGTLDNITGMVLKTDIFKSIAEDKKDVPLSEFKRQIMHVKQDLPLTHLFEKLLSERSQLAYVTDDYGATLGLVSLEDVIETILGLEIVDETDTTADMQKLAKENWEKRAKDLGLEK